MSGQLPLGAMGLSINFVRSALVRHELEKKSAKQMVFSNNGVVDMDEAVAGGSRCIPLGISSRVRFSLISERNSGGQIVHLWQNAVSAPKSALRTTRLQRQLALFPNGHASIMTASCPKRTLPFSETGYPMEGMSWQMSSAVNTSSMFVAILVFVVFPLILSVNAAPLGAGTYQVLHQWPTGIHEDMSRLADNRRQLCQALATAANATYGQHPFDLASDQLPTQGELQFTEWKPVTTGNDLAIATKLINVDWIAARGLPIKADKIEKLKDALAQGEVRLESTIVKGYWHDGETRFIRLHRQSHNESPENAYIGGQMVVVDDGGSVIGPIINIDHGEDIFSYQGHSYLFARSSRETDNHFKQILPPQPLLNVMQAVTESTSAATVCKVVFVRRGQQLR